MSVGCMFSINLIQKGGVELYTEEEEIQRR
jgi:hypothetical protein